MRKIKISDIAKLRNGFAFQSTDFKISGIPVIRISDFESDGIHNLENCVRVEPDEKYNKFQIKYGDILIAMSGATVGKISKFLSNELAYQNQRVGLFETNNKTVYSSYFYFFLKSLKNKIEIASYGGAQPNISSQKIENFEIFLPSYADQIRIAKILGKIQEVIQERRNAIDQLDELVKATFYDMFGDPSKIDKKEFVTIDEVAIQVTDGEHSTPIRTESGIKLLSARNIKNGYIDFTKGVDYVGIDEYKRIIKRCKPELQDILMSCSGSIGRVAVINIDEPLTLVRSVALIKPKRELLNSIYLMHWLQTDFLQFEIQKNSKKSSQANIFTGAIKKLPVYVANLLLQNQFAEIAQKIEVIKAEQEAQLKEMEELYASVSQQVFNGALDLTRVPFDESLLPEEEVKIDINKITIDKQLVLKPKEEVFIKLSDTTESSIDFKQFEEVNIKLPKDKFEFSIVDHYDDWKNLSFSTIGDIIKNKFKNHYFNTEMVLNCLHNEENINVAYYSSAEKKKKPELDNDEDFYGFIHSMLIDTKPFLALEQIFYDAEGENIKDISFREIDLELLAKKEKKERSGIYFRIKNETTSS